MSSDDKALPETMLFQIYIIIWRQYASLAKINGDKFEQQWRSLIFTIILAGELGNRYKKITWLSKLNPLHPTPSLSQPQQFIPGLSSLNGKPSYCKILKPENEYYHESLVFKFAAGVLVRYQSDRSNQNLISLVLEIKRCSIGLSLSDDIHL